MIAQSDTGGTKPALEAFNGNLIRLDSRELYQTGTRANASAYCALKTDSETGSKGDPPAMNSKAYQPPSYGD